MGFEPTAGRCLTDDGLANRCFQPLSHFSMYVSEKSFQYWCRHQDSNLDRPKALSSEDSVSTNFTMPA